MGTQRVRVLYTRRSFESLRICLHTVSSESLQHFFIPRPAVTPRELLSSARIQWQPADKSGRNKQLRPLHDYRRHAVTNASFFSPLFDSQKRSSLILVLLPMPLLLHLCRCVQQLTARVTVGQSSASQHKSTVNE